jgi:hypothetical protein
MKRKRTRGRGGDIRIGENKTKQVNSLRTKMYLSDLRTQFVPRSKHSASVIKTDKLMLYGEIIAVCSEIHTKHINALWAEHRISEY